MTQVLRMSCAIFLPLNTYGELGETKCVSLSILFGKSFTNNQSCASLWPHGIILLYDAVTLGVGSPLFLRVSKLGNNGAFPVRLHHDRIEGS